MVLLRFNHDAQSSLERWRLIINGTEFKVTSVTFHCPTTTSMNVVTLADGTEDVKYHIQGIETEIKSHKTPNGEVHFDIY
jgi:hypothetical protein